MNEATFQTFALKDHRLEFAQSIIDLPEMDRLLAESFEAVHDVGSLDGGAEALAPQADAP